MGSWRRRCCQV